MTVRTIVFSATLALLLAGCPPPRGVYHTVEAGQTLYSISRTYGIDEGYLARINHVDDPTLLQTGTRLYIPGVDRVRSVTSPTGTSSDPTKRSEAKSRSSSGQRSTPATRADGKTPSTARTWSAPPSVAAGTFSWPLRGDLLKTFSTGTASPSKGIEIAVPEGSPVVSSAAGRVIYSGNGIRGYGHLIILKHDDSFFTVYGYNRKNLVESGTFVSKGDRIALSGTPPSGGPSRLYFEIRHGKKAVDPIFYLP